MRSSAGNKVVLDSTAGYIFEPDKICIFSCQHFILIKGNILNNFNKTGKRVFRNRIISPRGKNLKGVEKKSDRLKYWLGIIVAFIAIFTFLLDIPNKIRELWTPSSSRFYGIVIDRQGIPVKFANIEIYKYDRDTVRIGVGKTTSTGEFNFEVKAKSGETTWVVVSRHGCIGFRGYKTLLGNSKILFKEER